MKNSYTLSSLVTASMGLSLLSIAPVEAADFSFQENPNVVEQPAPFSRAIDGNTLSVTNAFAFENAGDTATPESIFIIPFLFANVNGNAISLGWENDSDAYVSDNYDGLGNQLAVSVDNLPDRVRFGDIADQTGAAPFPTVIPCDTSPSCPPPAPFPLPVASQDSDDEIPFLSLGSFASGETKLVDNVFSFSYEGDRVGVLPVLPTFSVLSAVAMQSVPEPASVVGVMAVALASVGLKRRSSKK